MLFGAGIDFDHGAYSFMPLIPSVKATELTYLNETNMETRSIRPCIGGPLYPKWTA